MEVINPGLGLERGERAGFKKRQRESGSGGGGRGEGLGTTVTLQRAEEGVYVGVIKIKGFPWFHFWSFELGGKLSKPAIEEREAREFEVER